MDYEVDDTEDLDLIGVKVGDQQVATVGVVKGTGMVYIPGDVHPLGSYSALFKAAREHVPYVAVSAVSVLFPATWLRGECLADADRLRIIDNFERIARNGGV